jgi:hypothetical protein
MEKATQCITSFRANEWPIELSQDRRDGQPSEYSQFFATQKRQNMPDYPVIPLNANTQRLRSAVVFFTHADSAGLIVIISPHSIVGDKIGVVQGDIPVASESILATFCDRRYPFFTAKNVCH